MSDHTVWIDIKSPLSAGRIQARTGSWSEHGCGLWDDQGNLLMNLPMEIAGKIENGRSFEIIYEDDAIKLEL